MRLLIYFLGILAFLFCVVTHILGAFVEMTPTARAVANIQGQIILLMSAVLLCTGAILSALESLGRTIRKAVRKGAGGDQNPFDQ